MSEMFNKIQSLCDDNGMTITDLCRKCNFNRSSLTDLKYGRQKSLSASALSKIAALFGVTVGYFLDDSDSTGLSNITMEELSVQELTLLDLFREMSIIDQAKLIAFAAKLEEEQQQTKS